MPSPFPGMDPYLESPERWPGAHNTYITFLSVALNQALPLPYVADVQEHLRIVPSQRDMYPDISVRQHAATAPDSEHTGAVAVLPDVADAPLVVELLPTEPPETYIEVIDVQDDRRVVATIEVLSHDNKRTASAGGRLYRRKQEELLSSRSHLIEIDLLRAGDHSVAVPKESLEDRIPWDYVVSSHRGGEYLRYEVWLATVRERLPRVLIPLDPGVAPVPLDLQAALDACYDGGAYARKIDYGRDPVPPLRSEDALWADILLRGKGCRT